MSTWGSLFLKALSIPAVFLWGILTFTMITTLYAAVRATVIALFTWPIWNGAVRSITDGLPQIGYFQAWALVFIPLAILEGTMSFEGIQKRKEGV